MYKRLKIIYMYKILLLLSCIFAVSCGNKRNKITNNILSAPDMTECQDTCMVVDIDKVLSISSDSLLNIVKAIKYVPLDMSNEPVGAITDIAISDKYICLLDGQISKSIFIYKKNGQFVNHICAKGHGHGEYILPSSIEYDDSTNLLCVKDDGQSKFLYYDINGKFVKEDKTVSSIYCVHFGESVVNMLAEGQAYDSEINYHLIVSNGDPIAFKGIPYSNIQLDYFVSNKFRNNYAGNLLFHPVASDTVYQINHDYSYCPRFIIKNEKSLWNYKNQRLSLEKKTQLIKDKKLKRVSAFHEGRNYLFYSIYALDSKEQVIKNTPYIYNKDKRQAYRVEGLPPGEIKGFVPLDLLCVYKDWCVSLFNPYNLKMQLGHKYYINEPRLKNIVENSQVTSNPVLVFFKI